MDRPHTPLYADPPSYMEEESSNVHIHSQQQPQPGTPDDASASRIRLLTGMDGESIRGYVISCLYFPFSASCCSQYMKDIEFTRSNISSSHLGTQSPAAHTNPAYALLTLALHPSLTLHLLSSQRPLTSHTPPAPAAVCLLRARGRRPAPPLTTAGRRLQTCNSSPQTLMDHRDRELHRVSMVAVQDARCRLPRCSLGRGLRLMEASLAMMPRCISRSEAIWLMAMMFSARMPAKKIKCTPCARGNRTCRAKP